MKKILTALAFAAVSTIASADYIFSWSTGGHPVERTEGFEYVYLTVNKADTGAEVGSYAAYSNGIAWSTLWEDGNAYESTYAPDPEFPQAMAWIGDYNSSADDGINYFGSEYIFNFVVKGGMWDGYVRSLAGDTFANGTYANVSGGQSPSSTFNLGYYGFQIPEPSSALLLLLGAALVGLKRKVV